MPLVVPDLASGADASDPTQFWAAQLMGKTISSSGQHDERAFAKDKLPSNHRVVQEGGMMTMDFQPDRLNVHVGQDGIVKKVSHG